MKKFVMIGMLIGIMGCMNVTSSAISLFNINTYANGNIVMNNWLGNTLYGNIVLNNGEKYHMVVRYFGNTGQLGYEILKVNGNVLFNSGLLSWGPAGFYPSSFTVGAMGDDFTRTTLFDNMNINGLDLELPAIQVGGGLLPVSPNTNIAISVFNERHYNFSGVCPWIFTDDFQFAGEMSSNASVFVSGNFPLEQCCSQPPNSVPEPSVLALMFSMTIAGSLILRRKTSRKV